MRMQNLIVRQERQKRTEIFAAIFYERPKRLCSAIRFRCERTVSDVALGFSQSPGVYCMYNVCGCVGHLGKGYEERGSLEVLFIQYPGIAGW